VNGQMWLAGSIYRSVAYQYTWSRYFFWNTTIWLVRLLLLFKRLHVHHTHPPQWPDNGISGGLPLCLKVPWNRGGGASGVGTICEWRYPSAFFPSWPLWVLQFLMEFRAG